MADDNFWRIMREMFEDLEEKIEDEAESTRSRVDNKSQQIRKEQEAQAGKMHDIHSDLEEFSSTTWEDLQETEEFDSLSEKGQKIVWELAKIEEGDSPKNQSEVAEQYGVDRSRISQLKEILE